MESIVNRLVFPHNDRMEEYYQLYYRGERTVFLDEGSATVMTLRKYSVVDFSTYFNALSVNKWKVFAGLKNPKLHLFLKGEGRIKLIGLNLDNGVANKNIYEVKEFSASEKTEYVFTYPESDDTLCSFEIENLTDGILYEGFYTGEFENDREINLSIATTTCKKEKFIKRNVKSLYEKILCGTDEFKEHFFVHIVDNGNTLQRSDFPESESIFFHPNHNTGGAGGFARGMIECMHQEKPKSVTHVLLMDDDVIIEPESIYRTYILLRHLKPEYQKRFISGAMLTMENPVIQHEDVGFISEHGFLGPTKRRYDYNFLVDVIDNERINPETNDSYAGWWYCCIPIDTIKKNGLPLPLFVRGDDVEYSLRCKPGFITMNSICVWHMGFDEKINVGMEHYQTYRNLLIDQAVSGIVPNTDLMSIVRDFFKNHIYRLDYDSAEIVVKLIEDFNKGPDFIREDYGFEILKSNNALGHKLVHLSELGNPDWGYGDPHLDPYWTIQNKVVFKLTDNGHRFWINKYKKGILNIPINPSEFTPVRCSFRTELVAMDPRSRMGYLLKRDNKRYKALSKRFNKALKYYKKNKAELSAQYRASQKEFVSEEFWRKYLGI